VLYQERSGDFMGVFYLNLILEIVIFSFLFYFLLWERLCEGREYLRLTAIAPHWSSLFQRKELIIRYCVRNVFLGDLTANECVVLKRYFTFE
jgi:hypothetical protein